jgi:type IX secretion system PorP/SprF family membrane protein
MRKLYLYIFTSLLGITYSFAQDAQFTQFYAAPMYLNPAYAGASVCGRVSTTYRNQWPSIPNAFVSYLVSIDQSIPKLNSGLGIMISNDQAGAGKLRSTDFSALYSYQFSITKEWVARAGIQATETVRDLNFYDLTFSDQLSRGGNVSSVETPTYNKVSYFDISTGALIFSSNAWIGVSAHHLSQPNQSFIGQQSTLPMKLSIHGGYKKSIGYIGNEKKQYIIPAFNYRHQGDFDQLDLGLYYNKAPIVLGLWYRGIPIVKSKVAGYFNTDALSILVGYTIDELKIGYSYDITVSSLYASSGGAHEISITYQFCNYAALKVRRMGKGKKHSSIPCPNF